MKTFSRIRTVDEIRDLCASQGVRFVDNGFKQGFDHVLIGGPPPIAWAVYNVRNGKFGGEMPNGAAFTSSSMMFANEPWFQALFSFFYVE